MSVAGSWPGNGDALCAAVPLCFPLPHMLPGAYKCGNVGAWGLTLGHWGAAVAPALCLSPACWPLCPAAKPGYCYHIPEVEDLLDKDCGSCRMGVSCSHCTSDADCHGVTKCCPSKCGYTCQEPVLGEFSVLWWWGSGVAVWHSQGWVTGRMLADMG